HANQNISAPTPPSASAPRASSNSSPEVVRPSGEHAPPAATSLPEPKGPIDPKSAEAAGQVVQHYGALVEQKKWDDAAKLWGSSEAAAGSIYLSVPVTLYGKDAQGKQFRVKGTMILRRVNDVPGSTEAQRHWHIERIDRGGTD